MKCDEDHHHYDIHHYGIHNYDIPIMIFTIMMYVLSIVTDMEMIDQECTSDQDLGTEKEHDHNLDAVLSLNTAESVELRGSGSGSNRKRTSILTLFTNWNLALITVSVAFLWSVNLIGMGIGYNVIVCLSIMNE